MAREETLKDVSPDKVGAVVQGYVNDGASKVIAVKNTNKKWDVTAYFD